MSKDTGALKADAVVEPSRSVQRRVAVQKGEPVPEFDAPVEGEWWIQTKPDEDGEVVMSTGEGVNFLLCEHTAAWLVDRHSAQLAQIAELTRERERDEARAGDPKCDHVTGVESDGYQLGHSLVRMSASNQHGCDFDFCPDCGAKIDHDG